MGTKKSNRAGITAALALALSAFALAGCEETSSVGSGCANGNCPLALSRNDDACSTNIVHANFAIQAPGDERPLNGICLPVPLARRDDSTVDARVYYFLPQDAEPPVSCTDKSFLRPVSAAIREEYADHHPGTEMCEVRQLSVTEVDGGDPIVAAGDGFFYDDFTEASQSKCSGASALLNFTAAAKAWNGLYVDVTTTETRDAAGEVDPALVCEAIQGSEPVGTACSLTRTDIDDVEIVLETRVDACGDGICMGYHFGSDNVCVEPNDGSTLCNSRVYCTCRCDGPPGSADLCECPNGFACVDTVPTLEPALAGSYCVRQSAVIDE
jgi:hypothetical protein